MLQWRAGGRAASARRASNFGSTTVPVVHAGYAKTATAGGPGKWLQVRPRRPARIASAGGDMSVGNGLLAVGTKTIATRGAWRILTHDSSRSLFLLRLRRDCHGFTDLH